MHAICGLQSFYDLPVGNVGEGRVGEVGGDESRSARNLSGVDCAIEDVICQHSLNGCCVVGHNGLSNSAIANIGERLIRRGQNGNICGISECSNEVREKTQDRCKSREIGAAGQSLCQARCLSIARRRKSKERQAETHIERG